MFIGEDVNLLAVLVASIGSMVLGFAWYSPLLFGKAWMKFSKVTTEKMEIKKKSMQALYIISFLTSIIMAYVLAIFIDISNALTIYEGMTIGAIAWLGFVATTMAMNVLYENKHTILFFVNSGYQLLSLLLMGTILTLWQ